MIDLQADGWPVVQTPYLVPLHSSAITCSHHVSAIPLKLWERISAAGALQNTHYSKKVQEGQTSTELGKRWIHERYHADCSVNLCSFLSLSCGPSEEVRTLHRILHRGTFCSQGVCPPVQLRLRSHTCASLRNGSVSLLHADTRTGRCGSGTRRESACHPFTS